MPNISALKSKLNSVSYVEAGVLGLLILLGVGLFIFLPVTYKDWVVSFQPAAFKWLTPYHQPGLIFNPPWLFPFLHPVALLPNRLGAAVLMTVSVALVAFYVRSPRKLLAVTLSSPMIVLFTLGQIDALMLLGLMIPYGFGIPILMMKPQGVFLAALPRLNLRSIIFTGVVFIISILIWGFWWNNIIGYDPNNLHNNNFSLFPYSIPVGLILLYFGWKRKSDALLCFASLCLSPYFMITSALPAIAATARETKNWRVWAALAVGSWVYFIILRLIYGY